MSNLDTGSGVEAGQCPDGKGDASNTIYFWRYPVSPAGPLLTNRVIRETNERVRSSGWYRLLLYLVKIKCIFPDKHLQAGDHFERNVRDKKEFKLHTCK